MTIFAKRTLKSLLLSLCLWVCSTTTHALLANDACWQLNFMWHEDGKLDLLKATPIQISKKSKISPAAKGGLHEVPIRVAWFDADDKVLMETDALVPLGVRIPLGDNPTEPGLIRQSELFVLRLIGPSAKAGAVKLELRSPTPEKTTVDDHSQTALIPAIKLTTPQSFSLSVDTNMRPELAPSDEFPPPSTPGPIGVTKLQDTGPDDNRLVIVVVGDGYLESDINDGTYESHVNQTIAAFASDSPWEIMLPATNVYRIDVVSNERGADYEDASPTAGGTLKDTYFNTAFWKNGIERLLYGDSTGNSRAIAAADDYVGAGNWDQIVLIVNSTKYGGAGGFIATNSMNSSGPAISVHEVGHSFADLADEYTYPYDTYTGGTPSEVNVDTNGASPKWSNWVEAATPLPTPDTSTYSNVVGAFEGARYYRYGLYRPWRNCTMRNLNAGFCPVCREQHLRSFFSVVGLTDEVTPAQTNPVDVSSQTTLALSPVPISGLEYVWSMDGEVISGESSADLILTTADLPASSQTVSVELRFASSMMRSDAPIENFSWTINNTGVTAQGTPHWWLASHGLATTDEVDSIDLDGDGHNTHAEYLADTDPTSAADFLRFNSYAINAGQFQMSWQSRSGRVYTLMKSSNLTSWTPVSGYQSINGTGGLLNYSEGIGTGKKFFQVQANPP